jgi:ATP sulfurylase
LKKAKHKIELNERQMCDFELLSVGGFSPLTGFMVRTT